MRVVINSSSFGDIRTAVFYRFHKYIPMSDILESDLSELIENCISDKIQYRGNKEIISYGDFSEYDFSYIINKYKFNDSLKINFLDSNSKNVIGKNLDDLEKIESLIFPTYSNEYYNQEEEFFGSGLISNQTFLLLKASGNEKFKKGYWKIEFYEDSIKSNNINNNFIDYDLLKKLNNIEITNIPALSLYLGPDNLVKNNSSENYFSYDPALKEKEWGELMSIVDYRELEEEISMNKVIGVLISSSDKISVNLSYKAWVDSNNPNRNMKDWVVRNDEFFSTKDNIKIVEKVKETNFYIDKNSGNFLGNKEIVSSNFPILSRKINKIDNNIYSPYVRYKKGDKVFFSEYYWESLADNNYGNDPFLSNKWSQSSSISDFFTSRVSILSYPTEAGYTNPSGTITVTENTVKPIRIYENLGYIVDTNNVCSSNINVPLDKSKYNFNISVEPSGELIKTVTVNSWNDCISSGKLYINFKKVDSFCNFSSTIKGSSSTIDYLDWKNYFIEPNFEIKNIIINGEETTPVFDTDGTLYIKPYDRVKFIIPNLIKFDIVNVISNYLITNKPYTKTIPITITETGDNMFEDYIDFSNTNYKIELKYKEYIITVENSENVEISQAIGKVSYGNQYVLSFYEKTEDIKVSSITISNDLGEAGNLLISELNNTITIGKSSVILNYNTNQEIFNITIKNIISNFKVSFNYDNQ